MRFIWRIRHYLRPHAGSYLLAFATLQVVALLNLLPPWLIGRTVDAINGDTLTGATLAGYLAAIAAAALVMYGLRYTWQSQLYGASIKVAASLRSDLYRHFTRQSALFFQQYSQGDLMAHATNDLKAVEMAAGLGIMVFVDSLVAGLTILLAMVFVVSGELSLVALLPFPLLAWFSHWLGARLHLRFSGAQQRYAELTEELRETVAGIRAVRAQGIGERQQQRFEQINTANYEANIKVARVDGLFRPTIQVLYGVSLILALLYGAWMISLGQLSIGLLTSFTLYLSQLLGPLLQFGWQFNVFQRGNASWQRLEHLLAQQPAIVDGPEELTAAPFGTLEFRLTSFRYPGSVLQKQNGGADVLKQVQARVQQGQFIGITGPTGSGKSTLFALLQRHYALAAGGQILLGGRPIEDYTLASLRRRIAWVPQEPQLFSGTIAANIGLARPAASQAQIEQAAEFAGIHQDILGFSAGYQTPLGESGVNLSGGQKQRINLARAVLSSFVGGESGQPGADLLLLDDPFSALDMQSEAKIMRQLDLFRRSHPQTTVLLITQRLSALMAADRIWVLDGGALTGQGDHSELMAQDGWYRNAFRQQRHRLDQQEVRTYGVTPAFQESNQ